MLPHTCHDLPPSRWLQGRPDPVLFGGFEATAGTGLYDGSAIFRLAGVNDEPLVGKDYCT